MNSLVLVSPAAELADRLRAAAPDYALTVVDGPLPAVPAELFARVGGPWTATVLVIDARTDPAVALGLAGQLSTTCPTLGQVLVGTDDLALAALRAGVRDVCPPTATAEQLRRSLALAGRASTHAGTAAPVTPGRLISVVSPKGGVGKTTVASNIAVGLALREPASTVVVDLDVQFGDLGSALDLEPEFFLADTVRGAARNDAMVLKSFLTQHRTGLYAICAPPSPEQADELTADDITALLRTLKSQFRYVVVDTAPGLSEHTLAALDETTDPVLVTSMDVPGIRGLRKELDTLSRLNLLPGQRQLVLNMVDRKNQLTVADAEATVEARFDLTLPRSRAALTSVNQGVPLLESRLRDPLTKQLDLLVTRLAGPADGPRGAGPAPRPAERRRIARTKGPEPRRAASRWRRATAAVVAAPAVPAAVVR
ncbi:pilus assembly protein CpaE [Friedmanniella endophytica]|uniref:Pilus assembly protein CpaE n=1 Tax=Microlunatus kandeliicorticis TaxID=1759536 RepID=A0A7W3IPU1_9ACTN|nr:AAA family ATPase [Microlunatus kandeliicorticis]MBA8793009.1 pilus assembly protein CpaE [Microlunatus kandeliicorticis]